MPAENRSNLHWGERAFEYAQKISLLATVTSSEDGGLENSAERISLPGRGSATQAENKAADSVRQQLEQLGIVDIESQAFEGLRSIWLFFAQAFGFALAGHGAFWLLARPVGIWAAMIISLALFTFGGILLWRKFTFQPTPLHQTLPHGPSQNVLAVLHPTGKVRQRIVLLGHLDSHRAVFWYAHNFSLKLYALGIPLVLYGVLAAPILYILSGIIGWMIFAYCGAVFGLLHFAIWMTGMTADLGPYSPGANDNASAVGSLLALAERIQAEPLQHTEVQLAFTGCEETGCGGLLAFLNECGEDLKDALWLDFELVGIGDRLVYLSREGILKKGHIQPEIEAKLNQAAKQAGIPLEPMDASRLGVFTEAGALWEHGYQAACLVSTYQGKTSLPQWHRLSDTIDRLEPEALNRAHLLAWSMIQDLDKL